MTRPVKPFSCILREVFDSKLTMRYVKAFRGDGASSHAPLEQSDASVPSTMYEGRNIRLPAEQRHIVIYDALRAQSVYYLRPEVKVSAGTVKIFPSCSDRAMTNGNLKGSELLMGLQTFHWSHEEVLNGSVEKEDLWLSPDIDCRVVRRTIVNNGQIRLLAEIESLQKGEPDPLLFVPPSDYREIPPSQAAKEVEFLRRGVRLDPEDARNKCVLDGLVRLDRQYQDSQKYRPVE